MIFLDNYYPVPLAPSLRRRINVDSVKHLDSKVKETFVVEKEK